MKQRRVLWVKFFYLKLHSLQHCLVDVFTTIRLTQVRDCKITVIARKAYETSRVIIIT